MVTMGFFYINDEHKIRISLSEHAYKVMQDDMRIFSIKTQSAFINTVFENFRETAHSSVHTYLENKRNFYSELFENCTLDASAKETTIETLMQTEKKSLMSKLNKLNKKSSITKLYHLTNSNVKFLENECNEDSHYAKPSKYLKFILEEYTNLPFIEREQIFRKDLFELIESALQQKRILKVPIYRYNQKIILCVYPYKIISDQHNTQLYLTCFTKHSNELKKDKIIASFTLSRLTLPTLTKSTFSLSKEDISKIEKEINKRTVPYLINEPCEIHIKLTQNGERAFETRLHSRPHIISKLKNREYILHCSEQQAYDYFFNFGKDVEILGPKTLRHRFITNYNSALNSYRKQK